MAETYRIVPLEVIGPVELPEPENPVDDEEYVRKSPALGFIALGLSTVTAVLQVVAIVVASDNDFAPATALAYAAIVMSIVAVSTGILAVLLSRGKLWGYIAVALGVIGNPMVLLTVLRFFEGLEFT